jgi:hypothetical protein
MVMMDISRNATKRQAQIVTDFEYSIQGIRNQQAQSDIQTESQIDYTTLPKPNIANSLLDWGASTGMRWWESEHGVKGGAEI